jgi:hypothetical protein
MYYDRRIPTKLLSLIAHGGPLAWLVEYARSDEGRAGGLHIQLRRDERNRKHGCIHVYLGRTSPLQIEGRHDDDVQLAADATYQDLCPELFGRMSVSELGARAADLEAHLELCRDEVAPSGFLEGEGAVHAGLMRRYGLDWSGDDPLLAVDSEARIGFGSRAEASAFYDANRRSLELPDRERMPMKLDTVGLLDDGRVALVELKDEGGDLERALVQIAAQTLAFRQLTAQPDYDLAEVLVGLATQKSEVGLIRRAAPQARADELVPVVAAPGDGGDWVVEWRQALSRVTRPVADVLVELRLFRLSTAGEILEEAVI